MTGAPLITGGYSRLQIGGRIVRGRDLSTLWAGLAGQLGQPAGRLCRGSCWTARGDRSVRRVCRAGQDWRGGPAALRGAGRRQNGPAGRGGRLCRGGGEVRAAGWRGGGG